MIQKIAFHKLKRWLITFLYPARCPFCNEVIDEEEYYCGKCFVKLSLIDAPLDGLKNIEFFCAVCWYEGIVKNAIWRLKKDRYIYSAETFGKMIYDMLKAYGQEKNIDCIIPVPVNTNTLKSRGYNQAMLIAKEISVFSGIPIMDKAIIVSDKKQEQKKLNAKQRAENAKKAFLFSGKSNIIGLNILLIDDVCTTGSTLSVLAEMLIENGARNISAAVFAKTK